MSYSKRLPVLAIAAVAAVALAAPGNLQAQPRAGGRPSAGRAVPRPAAPRGPRPVIVAPRSVRPYYYGRPYFGASYFVGPLGYGGFGGWYGYGYPGYYPRAYGYPGYYGYPAYGYPGYIGGVMYGGRYRPYGGGRYRPYGGVRIDVPIGHAEVWVGGYFVGHVDDFDGSFQQLNLEPGPHRIEIREPGYETIAFDVRIEPGRTIHYRGEMRPTP